MQKEKTQMKDRTLIKITTPLVLNEIPNMEIPSSRLFDVRTYKERNWVLIFFDRDLWENFREVCEKKGLDPKRVLYGSLIKIRKQLEG